MKQSAVEWLVNEIITKYDGTLKHFVDFYSAEIEQAKAMENEQQGYSEEEVMNMACALFDILQLRKKVEKQCENIAYNTNDIFDGIQYMANGIGEILEEHNINIDKLKK